MQELVRGMSIEEAHAAEVLWHLKTSVELTTTATPVYCTSLTHRSIIILLYVFYIIVLLRFTNLHNIERT